MLLGIKKTTPAIASAMPNLSPGLIFIVAACFRLERFDKACKYTQAKIAGTVVCLVGAVAMSFLQSPSSPSPSSSLAAVQAAAASADGDDDYYDWILGCCCLVAGVTVFALVTVLQAATLASLPAPLTMCCVTSATGAALTAVLRLVLEGKFLLDMGSPNIDATLVAGIVVLGGGVVGACTAFQAWCLGRKGPLFVSVFGPVQTVCTAILFAALLRQVLSLGRLPEWLKVPSLVEPSRWPQNHSFLGSNVPMGHQQCQHC
ncbi:hypothetical protein GQ55_1G169600 [Panicum hallii var. hallii]|uniref:WAT1-related protein n=1 Tax=Panicum hallii var. hallii TaxID=1504633 RepID=A0A2T7F5V2_9POAL|nr:hypothetical protein GQ55_1G169600 [Panicum hallii var. hallii]